MTLSALKRPTIINDLKSEKFDVLIIGGGITGVGIALDAASRGLKTALVEKDDFASGTSSRSTKLIHGGLRYLKQFEIALVREVGRERATLHRLAPHLVTSEKMMLPLIKGGNFGAMLTSIGLMVYDVLAGVVSADQRKMLTVNEALEKEPLLDRNKLEGAGIYAEYRTDDARLTIEVMKAAVEHGAICLNYVQANEFIYKDNEVYGIKAQDNLTGEVFDVIADMVVSATGPWVDEVRKKDHSLKGKRLHLTKGVHLVVPHHKFPVKQAVYFDVKDGRMIFAIPRGAITYIGTTDTDYTGDKDHVLTNKEDVEYLLKAVNHTFPKVNLTKEDVSSSWAGLRPLIHEEGKSASDLSRKDEIFISGSGLISIAGGKLTGYRKMAARVVDVVINRLREFELDVAVKKCKTREIPLAGAGFNTSNEIKVYISDLEVKWKLAKEEVSYLVCNYGKQTDEILANWNNGTEEELLISECRFCIEKELTITLCDFFIRRTGRLYFDIEKVREHYKVVAREMEMIFSWNSERFDKEIADLERVLYEASHFE